MARTQFVWEAHEYIFQEKSSDWYWAVGIISASAAVISIIFGNILFALLIALAGFALALFAAKEPAFVRFELNKTGVIVGKILYPYGTLESFWVEDNQHHEFQSKLFIKSQKMAMPLIVIPLENVDPGEIRDFLLDHLLEEHNHEGVGQKLLEYLGF